MAQMPDTLHVAAIIAAGGRGARLGAGRPKQFLEIGGRSILELSVAALAASDRITEIVVALPAEHLDAAGKSLRAAIARPVTVVAGGERRQDSVANAFAKTAKQSDIILVHDAARPFVTRAVIDRAVDDLAGHERPRRIVNQDDVGVLGRLRERVRHRVLTPRATGDHRDRPADRPAQRLPFTGNMLLGQGDDDFRDAIAGRQRGDAQFHDGAAADLEKLFRPVGAKTRAAAACGDNGGDVHIRIFDCTRRQR